MPAWRVFLPVPHTGWPQTLLAALNHHTQVACRNAPGLLLLLLLVVMVLLHQVGRSKACCCCCCCCLR
jgi:hypothetical protein